MISETQIQADVCPVPALRIPDEALIAQEMERTGLERRHCISRIQVLAAMSKAARQKMRAPREAR